MLRTVGDDEEETNGHKIHPTPPDRSGYLFPPLTFPANLCVRVHDGKHTAKYLFFLPRAEISRSCAKRKPLAELAIFGHFRIKISHHDNYNTCHHQRKIVSTCLTSSPSVARRRWVGSTLRSRIPDLHLSLLFRFNDHLGGK
uniref:(northern house mosquito) hypothetical protein n=1 Tax=Culex pipiens TaxID=7175 RepID=A0A8D8B8W2_CULPI